MDRPHENLDDGLEDKSKACELSISDFPSPVSIARITYADDVRGRAGHVDADQGPAGRARSRSRDSAMSIRNVGMRRSVDPSLALPPAFRSLSFGIDDTNRRSDLKDQKPINVAVARTNLLGRWARFVNRFRRPKRDADAEALLLSKIDFHTAGLDELTLRFSTSQQRGLSSSQAAQRIREVGRNVPTPPESRWFSQTMGYLFGGFGPILFVASILVFISWKPLGEPAPAVANLALAIVLAVVWLIQAAFSFWQDFSSSRVMASITSMLPEECTVLRDGVRRHVDGRDVAPGDVLAIRMGNKLPADVRFLEASPDARFDRSILTGETAPLLAALEATDDNYLETANIGLAGTHCVSGSAWGLIVSTGDRTVFGQIASRVTAGPRAGLTSLQKEILRFVLLIVAVMVTVVVVVIAIWAGWLRRDHPDFISVPALIVSCVSVAVAFIPEGMPIAVTASLTITARIMSRNKVLCKSLKTVETLGIVNVLCSDKTGTLTRNQMNVTDFFFGDAARTADAAAECLEDNKGLRALVNLAAVCNEAEFDAATMDVPVADRKVNGDATDSAILRFAESMHSVSDTRDNFRPVFKIAFNSRNKFAINVVSHVASVDVEKTGQPLLMIKGAPDILLARCSHSVQLDGTVVAMSRADRAAVGSVKDGWSSQGKRVILLASKQLTGITLDPARQAREYEREIMAQAGSDLVLCGLVGIVDPPRTEIPEVVVTLRGAGIRVFMVTGDFKLTAQAIAAQCGIITSPPAEVHGSDDLGSDDDTDRDGSPDGGKQRSHHRTRTLTVHGRASTRRSLVLSGSDVEGLSGAMWDRVAAYEEIVFARTTPEHKLRIVRELRQRGLVVGMTGDGVNDAPSLKEADIGIAMGSGSDVAIEAADMVLLDSFAAIVEAVRLGRTVFDNLRKSVAYLLPAGSLAEFFPVITNICFGLPQILSSFLMIIICCLTDAVAATCLAYEAPEADVLDRPPRDARKDRLVDWKLLLQAYGFIGLLETLSSFAMSYWYAQRVGLEFSELWFGFGTVPQGMTQDRYVQILNTASSIYFVNLVVMQWFVVFALRTRRLSVLQHRMNWLLLPAICFALIFAIFWLYVPSFHSTLGTAHVPVEHWFLPMAFGMAILLLDEGRKWCVRRWPRGLLARVAW